MSTQVQYRRGSAAENNAFTGALAELTVDTTNGTIRVHNGITAGGSNIATVAYVDNAISSLSANSITDGTTNVTIIATNGNVRSNVGGTTISTLSSIGLEVTGVVTASGNVTGGNLVTAGTVSAPTITKTGSNGAGNIGQSNNTFNTVFAKATSAQYADVAERYVADKLYTPGTVLEIGGTAEVTETTTYCSTKIAGVVSTEPALIMNAGAQGSYVAAVALLGRVPCQVAGKIKRGDLLCSSSIPGHAVSLTVEQYLPGAVIGKALEDHAGPGTGVIEVLVGRL